MVQVGLHGEGRAAEEAAEVLEASEGMAVERLSDLDDVRRRSPDLDVLVVIPGGRRRRLARMVGRVQGVSSLPLVVVTEDPERAALVFRTLRIDGLVEPSRVREELPEVVRSAGLPPGLENAARAAASSLSDPVRGFVVAALRGPRPFTRVGELLEHLGVPSRTFHRVWARELPGSTPKELLEWVLLVHAVERKGPSRSWSRLARVLSVSPDTLRRIARRRMGTDLRAVEPEEIQRGFRAYVRRTLL